MSERKTTTAAEFYEAMRRAGRPVCSTFEPAEVYVAEGRQIDEWTHCRHCRWSQRTHGMVDEE